MAISNCKSGKAQGANNTNQIQDTNSTIYKLIQLINPDQADPEIDRLIQLDVLKQESLYFSEEWVKALRAYYRELKAMQETGNYLAQGNIYKKIAYAYSALGIPQRVIKNHEYALEAYEKAGYLLDEPFIDANFLHKMGNEYLKFGELAKAEQYLQYAHWKYESEQSAKFKIADNLYSLSQVYARMDRKTKAIDYYQKAYGNISCERQKNYLFLAKIYLDLKQTEPVIDCLKLLLEQQNTSRAARFYRHKTYNYLAQAYLLENDLEQAISTYNLVLERNNINNTDKGDSYAGLGKISKLLDKDDRAIAYWLKALHVYRRDNEINNILKIQDTLRRIGNAHQRLKKPQRAIAYYEQSLTLAFEARHLLLAADRQEFYLANDDSLNNLLLLLEVTNQKDKYDQWQKQQNTFKFNRYLRSKFIDDFLTNPEERKIVRNWRGKISLLRRFHLDMRHFSAYDPICEQYIDRYQYLKQEINNLALDINQAHSKIAELLQIENQQLAIGNLARMCRNPLDIRGRWLLF